MEVKKMSLAKITINSFLNYSNNTLFDNLTLPYGIDKDLLIDNIVMEAGEFELVYANLDFMKSAIGVWSAKNYRTFEKWINALNVEYNPLENYDRIEEWKETHSGNKNGTTTTNESSSNSGSISNNQNNTSTNNVSAYDATTLVTESQNIDGGSSSSSSNGSTSSNGTVTTNDNESTSDLRSGRTHGNIGVTTSQQMLESELNIAKWNVYKHITDLFMQEFCIMVYI
jgi:hypothetical protein